jgi:myo-inositol-1(or 4)-monophosphatase
MNHPLQFASQLAQETGELLLEYFHIKGIPANLKPDRTVITKADQAADELISASIRDAFPGEKIVSEEADTTVGQINHPIWVIDPLDGTTNFSLGLHTWGVSIARIVKGMPDTAALFFPILRELYTSQRDQGAFLNGEPIHVKPLEKDQPAAFATCCSRTFRHYQVNLRYKPRIFGSAAYDLCLVARGAAILGFQAQPKIWDLAGGWLLVEEAGGIVEPFEGPTPFPLTPHEDYERIFYPIIMAANDDLAKEVRSKIKPIKT